MERWRGAGAGPRTHFRRAVRGFGIAAALAAVGFAQTPAFDAASIKPARTDSAGRSLTHDPGGRLTTSNATLKMLIMLAYRVMPHQIAGGPGWVASDGFDMDAKAARPDPSGAHFRAMLQNLLAERFQLRVHQETRELPVYLLVVAKNGPKMAAAKGDEAEPGARVEGPGQLTGVGATMAGLATALSRPLQQTVIDRTGLSGAYNFKLRFAPDAGAVKPGGDAAGTGDDPDLVTALQQQLGLSLKTGKGPVDVLVIDHAERPTPN
jgi:uncharacterized protein (TIGR03435 family)